MEARITRDLPLSQIGRLAGNRELQPFLMESCGRHSSGGYVICENDLDRG
jgi:hypothetical protein